ncbi:TrmH family RNA methyltransferase [Pseudohaliea rubra]|uniref:RNA methyltransferase, TrmA family n=1 Tax=Pseudohaliea rubra DSM 19751 TaxID=1265313 RepID=A0A095WYQ4_9GAMM|nr:RNA methyltransferase [Pseudohaliea rubra]KGE03754.1 RNA methyltransferase, TrmA family [Pseudohaliea rubra DSM 19751]
MSDYGSKRRHYRGVLTVYGRKPVLEALADPGLACERLHLASSNRRDPILTRILDLAAERGVETRGHSREALARISRNGRQDQGVALDIRCPHFAELGEGLAALAARPATRLLALDGVTNPQNAGMAIRSARAGDIDGILYADRGNPALGPLVIKGSAGTLYGAPLLRCGTVAEGAAACRDAGYTVYTLAAGAPLNLFTAPLAPKTLFVLGGESDGVSPAVQALATEALSVPMAEGVESLNVAVTAALVAYAAKLRGG